MKLRFLEPLKKSSLYLPPFLSRFYRVFFFVFAKQRFYVDGFFCVSVNPWIFGSHLTHRGEPFCKVGEKYFLEIFSPYLLLTFQRNVPRIFSALADQQGLGKALPNKIDHKEQNEQRAKFGTVVESCSNNSRIPSYRRF